MLDEGLGAILSCFTTFSRRPIDALYDLAWGSFALKELGKRFEHFLANIRSAVAMITVSDKLDDVLYDYRRAVGLSLSLYLFGTDRIGFPESRVDELCDVLIRNSKESGLAELIGASLLVIKSLKRKSAEPALKNLMEKIRASCKENPAYYIADLLCIAFFSAMVQDEFFISALWDVKRNQSWVVYVEEDPERMAFLLYALSKATYSGKVDREVSEWCREELSNIAEKLYNDLKERSVLDPKSFTDLIKALLGVAEGFDAQTRQEFGSLIRIEGDNEIIINRDAIEPLPRIDLLAKAYIALTEAGYISPFMLSKKEVDAYRQIRAELKGYRRIRKYELIFIMTTSAIFISLMLSMLISIIAFPTANVSLPIVNAGLLVISIIVIVISIYWRIWKTGFISLKELLVSIYSILKKLLR